MSDSTAAGSVSIIRVGSGGLALVRDNARSAGARIASLADRDDVARYPVLVRALRNIGGLPDRPAQELVLGAVTIGIMVATDSWVVDLAGNLVAILLVNHPHEPSTQEPVDAAKAVGAVQSAATQRPGFPVFQPTAT